MCLCAQSAEAEKQLLDECFFLCTSIPTELVIIPAFYLHMIRQNIISFPAFFLHILHIKKHLYSESMFNFSLSFTIN